jgi:putative flavoprotein involved in K+ transport
VAAAPAARERVDVVVIGSGQAGLSVGYHLRERGLRFVILDAEKRIGDAWRKRWDSLRLFTPARFDGLDGMPFPAPPNHFPPRTRWATTSRRTPRASSCPCARAPRWIASGAGRRYFVRAGALTFEADQVVVAMASYQRRKLPAFAAELAPGIVQLHSSEYRNPGQLREGGVLIAGAGNSGAEIALELARGHQVWMSGRHTGEVPFRIGGFWGRLVLTRLVLRFLFHRVLTVRTPLGRKARPKVLHRGGPLIRTKTRQLRAAGVERVGRVVGVREGQPVLDDGGRLDVANVVWCTGYHPGFSWIDLPVMGEDGEPRHHAGVATGHPGLYFVGLHFLYSMSSTMIHGVGRDAARIADAVVARAQAPASARDGEHALMSA